MTEEIIAHRVAFLIPDRSIPTNWLRVFRDTDNETVYSTWNDFQMSLKVIGNVMLR